MTTQQRAGFWQAQIDALLSSGLSAPLFASFTLTMPHIYLYRAPVDFRKQAEGVHTG